MGRNKILRIGKTNQNKWCIIEPEQSRHIKKNLHKPFKVKSTLWARCPFKVARVDPSNFRWRRPKTTVLWTDLQLHRGKTIMIVYIRVFHSDGIVRCFSGCSRIFSVDIHVHSSFCIRDSFKKPWKVMKKRLPKFSVNVSSINVCQTQPRSTTMHSTPSVQIQTLKVSTANSHWLHLLKWFHGGKTENWYESNNMDGILRKKTHLWISLLSIFWWEPDPCTQMDFTRLWRHWDDMPSSSAGTFKKMVHSAGSRNACRPAYWLTMAWHSCNVISGFIVNAFINHHLSTININKRPNWSSIQTYRWTMPCGCCRFMKNYSSLPKSLSPMSVWVCSSWSIFHILHMRAYVALHVFYRPLGVHPIIRLARGRVSLGFIRAGKHAEMNCFLS